jgi:hypothetical protein
MSDLLGYVPIIKSVGFAPSPVASAGGPPDFANSSLNPKCVGTIAHEDWWDQERDRCINGYETGGIHIPGRYYYYLNYCLLLTVGRGYHYPDFTDLDLEFFRLVDFCKKDGQYKNDPTAGGKGIIMPKRRRVGRSHVMAAIISHGVRFNPAGYNAGIVSGLSDYSEDFFAKYKDYNDRQIREFYLHTLHANQDHWQAGYKQVKTRTKNGSFNNVYCLTANSNENVFKGKVLNDCVFEEAGEFKNILKTYGATKSCFMRGMQMVGVPYIFGTGGNMVSSEGFKSMLENADDYDLIPFEIYGPRMVTKHFIGSTNEFGEVEEDCPYLMAKYGHLSKEQILGCEDVVRASEVIMEIGNKLKMAKNKQPYYDHMQTFPMNRREMFLNFTGNPFSPERLATQAYEISLLHKTKYKRYLLDWERDKDGKIVEPRKVNRKFAPETLADDDCVLMLEDFVPGFKDLDVAGLDSYDLNQSSTSKSLGAMVVIRRRDTKQGGNIIRRPICVVRTRPAKKEDFYDTCLKVAYYYNLVGNVLIDIEKGLVIRHFEENGGRKFLAERPRALESKNSEQQHKHGMKFTTYSKPMAVALMQGWVDDDIEECWFPILIKELGDYNVGVTGKDSDWDAADALMLALCRILDMKKPPRNDVGGDDAMDMPDWQTRGGRVVDLNSMSEHAKQDGGYFHTTGVDRFEQTGGSFQLPDFE